MKKAALYIFIILSLAACAAPTPAPSTSTPKIATTTAIPQPTKIPTSLSTSTSTSIPITPTVGLAQLPTRTPQPPAACPQVNAKLRISLGLVFKDKKATYHDARQTVLDFLNEGGDPQLAIQKLAENGVTASQMDITNDGVKEFFLPSGYFTIFGCQGGKYATLLDLAPTEDTEIAAVPLLIQDFNLNGVPELFIGQAQHSDQAMYRLLEWDGSKLANLAPTEFQKDNTKIYIDKQIIYTIGQSNAQKGALLGNYEIVDTDGNGLKEIIIHAGVYKNWFDSSSLEDTIILKWDGKSYAVGKVSKEATPTQIPTLSPDQFLADCSNINSNIRYTYNETMNWDSLQQSILDFLNRGGKPELLKSYFPVMVEDLNNDKIPEILIIYNFAYVASRVNIYGCVNGKHETVFTSEITGFTSHDSSILGSAIDPGFEGTVIQDINKNGLPEVFIKSLGCMFSRCGELNVIEWNGKEFAKILKDLDNTDKTNIAEMFYPQKVFLRDLDNDGIPEIGWVGGVPDSTDYGIGLPWRLETHIYKWDGTYFTARPIQYAAPEYRFQAVQDGDRFAMEGKYTKALASYKAAIQDNLSWWTKQRENYLQSSYQVGDCANLSTPCPPPTPDPNERPLLSAYASFRIILMNILVNEPEKAESQYQEMLKTYPQENAGYPFIEMATAFWTEYQSAQNMSNACEKAVAYATEHPNILTMLGSDYHGWQSLTYKPLDVCSFK
jgi:hypothetical protein